MYFFTYFNSNNNKELIFQISAQTANFTPFYRLFKFFYKSRALTSRMWVLGKVPAGKVPPENFPPEISPLGKVPLGKVPPGVRATRVKVTRVKVTRVRVTRVRVTRVTTPNP